MIQIPDSEDIKDLNEKLLAVCRHLKIKLITSAATTGRPYKAVTHWPFEGGFPREPLNNPPKEKL